MRILMTCNTLGVPAGSETATYTLAIELMRRGHDITCVSRKIGMVAEHLTNAGIRVERSAGAAPKPDVIHAQHKTESLAAHAAWPDVPIVLTTHGLPNGEEEVADIPLAAHVAVSMEVAKECRFVNPLHASTVIYNAIDPARFKECTPIRRPHQVGLFLSHYEDGPSKEVVKQACALAGLQYLEAGLPDPVWDVERIIHKADVVFTVGRGVLEAISCGRKVVVYDKGKGDGAVNRQTFNVYREKNFSGRMRAVMFTPEELVKEIADAAPLFLPDEHTIAHAASRYEAIYQEVTIGHN